MIKLSVLDQVPISEGKSSAEAVKQSVILAKTTEYLGYHRYWFAEHHNMDGLSCPTPEIMIPLVASNTSKIRVGSGGIMLQHYSPYKIAENFGLLNTLFPGRIDLGIGRAGGGYPQATLALQQGEIKSVENFLEKLTELNSFLRQDFPKEHPYYGLKPAETNEINNEIWLLGSSDRSAEYAATIGSSFSFAHFINNEIGPKVMTNYLEGFTPSDIQKKPAGSVGVFALCAESQEEAEQLATSMAFGMMKVERGLGGCRVPTVRDAIDYPYSHEELIHLQQIKARFIVGTPDLVKENLIYLSELYGVDEFVILTVTHDFDARVRSYELLAKSFLPKVSISFETEQDRRKILPLHLV